jgi:RNA polymerase II subunit A small phosphatase-like protein
VVPLGDIAFPARGPEVNEPGRDGWALVVIDPDGAITVRKEAPPFLRDFRRNKWHHTSDGLLVCPPLAELGSRRAWPVSMGDASQAKEVGLRGVAPMDKDEGILLILDLDETLVHAIEQPLSRPCDFFIEPYHVYQRPHLGEFLTACAGCYRLAIWSSGGSDYVRAVVGRIMPRGIEPVLAWDCRRCTRHLDRETREEVFLKDLKKIRRAGFDLHRVLIVEDAPQKVKRHYGNAIYVPPYYGEDEDDVLPRLARYLISIHQTPNVRVVEKRGWYQQQIILTN